MRNYSSRDVFRQTPNAMLARYFASKSLLAGLDFGAMKEGLARCWKPGASVKRSAIFEFALGEQAF